MSSCLITCRIHHNTYSYQVTGTTTYDHQFSISVQTDRNIHTLTHMHTQ